jgi:hypothetical protein
MLSVFQQSHTDLLQEYLKYCSAFEIRQLRQVSRLFKKRIPVEWIYERFAIYKDIPRRIFHFFQISDTTLANFDVYLFVEKLVICESDLKQVIIKKSPKHLTRIVIACSYGITTVSIPHTSCLQELLINEVPSLKNLHIDYAQPYLKSVSLFDVCLDNFNIYNWPHLESIMIVNNTGLLQTLIIPEKCTRLKSVQLINTKVQIMYFNPIVTHCVSLFTFRVFPIRVITPKANTQWLTSMFMEYFNFEYC